MTYSFFKCAEFHTKGLSCTLLDCVKNCSKINVCFCLFVWKDNIYVQRTRRSFVNFWNTFKKIFQCALCLDQNKNTFYNSATIKSFWILKNGSLEKKRKLYFTHLGTEKVFPNSGRHLSKINQGALFLNLVYQIWKFRAI